MKTQRSQLAPDSTRNTRAPRFDRCEQPKPLSRRRLAGSVPSLARSRPDDRDGRQVRLCHIGRSLGCLYQGFP